MKQFNLFGFCYDRTINQYGIWLGEIETTEINRSLLLFYFGEDTLIVDFLWVRFF